MLPIGYNTLAKTRGLSFYYGTAQVSNSALRGSDPDGGSSSPSSATSTGAVSTALVFCAGSSSPAMSGNAVNPTSQDGHLLQRDAKTKKSDIAGSIGKLKFISAFLFSGSIGKSVTTVLLLRVTW